jgi:hypothetical protein
MFRINFHFHVRFPLGNMVLFVYSRIIGRGLLRCTILQPFTTTDVATTNTLSLPVLCETSMVFQTAGDALRWSILLWGLLFPVTVVQAYPKVVEGVAGATVKSPWKYASKLSRPRLQYRMCLLNTYWTHMRNTSYSFRGTGRPNRNWWVGGAGRGVG